MIPTVSVSIPLQTLTHAADTQPAGAAIPEHESGWNTTSKEEKDDSGSSLTTRSPGLLCYLQGACWIKELWSDTRLSWATRVKNSPAVKKQIPQAFLTLNHPKRFFFSPDQGEELSAQWLVICQNGWWSMLIVSPWPVFNSTWLACFWAEHDDLFFSAGAIQSVPRLQFSADQKWNHTVWRMSVSCRLPVGCVLVLTETEMQRNTLLPIPSLDKQQKQQLVLCLLLTLLWSVICHKSQTC